MDHTAVTTIVAVIKIIAGVFIVIAGLTTRAVARQREREAEIAELYPPTTDESTR